MGKNMLTKFVLSFVPSMHQKMTFPCSLDTFMNMFFANEAPSLITKFQKETIGDKESQLTK
jgi:hypothetical protein